MINIEQFIIENIGVDEELRKELGDTTKPPTIYDIYDVRSASDKAGLLYLLKKFGELIVEKTLEATKEKVCHYIALHQAQHGLPGRCSSELAIIDSAIRNIQFEDINPLKEKK